MQIEVKRVKKDYYNLVIDGKVVIENKERSFFRHIVQEIDNAINVGL